MRIFRRPFNRQGRGLRPGSSILRRRFWGRQTELDRHRRVYVGRNADFSNYKVTFVTDDGRDDTHTTMILTAEAMEAMVDLYEIVSGRRHRESLLRRMGEWVYKPSDATIPGSEHEIVMKWVVDESVTDEDLRMAT